MLDRYLAKHPPSDWLVASYLGFVPVDGARAAAKSNSAAISEWQKQGVHADRVSFDQLPDYVRTPETKAFIAQLKAEWS